MKEQYIRTERVIGTEALVKLHHARVAVFGLGGVGGNCVEALARAGIGTFDLIDDDEVVPSNLNRQAFALHSTIGMKKTDAARQRILDIDPDAVVHLYPMFYLPETADQIPFAEFDYIVDAIDTVTAKLDIIERAQTLGIPIISSMGTGNRLDPSRLSIKDVYETSGDPLARIMRHELRKRGIRSLTVCTSSELPVKPLESTEEPKGSRRSVPGSTSFVPPAAGILIASHVVKEIAQIHQ